MPLSFGEWERIWKKFFVLSFKVNETKRKSLLRVSFKKVLSPFKWWISILKQVKNGSRIFEKLF